jgi:hypothetical protein
MLYLDCSCLNLLLRIFLEFLEFFVYFPCLRCIFKTFVKTKYFLKKGGKPLLWVWVEPEGPTHTDPARSDPSENRTSACSGRARQSLGHCRHPQRACHARALTRTPVKSAARGPCAPCSASPFLCASSLSANPEPSHRRCWHLIRHIEASPKQVDPATTFTSSYCTSAGCPRRRRTTGRSPG